MSPPPPLAPLRRSCPRYLALVVLALLVLAPHDEAQCADPGERDGTHFIAEATLGAALPLGAEPDGVGLAAGALLGFGGKLPRMLLRLYVIAGYRHASMSIHGHSAAGEPASLDRVVDEIGVGGRALVPLVGPWLRLFADGMLAAGWLRDETALGAGMELERVDPTARATVLLALGLQLRPVLWLSVGAQANLSLLLDRAELPADDPIGRIDLVGSITFHF